MQHAPGDQVFMRHLGIDAWILQVGLQPFRARRGRKRATGDAIQRQLEMAGQALVRKAAASFGDLFADRQAGPFAQIRIEGSRPVGSAASPPGHGRNDARGASGLPPF
jgi:hypothetical protein